MSLILRLSGVVDLFTGLGFVALAVALYFLLLRRGVRRERRRSDAAGAHDDGVYVDEAAWTEIVKHLKNGHSPDEPGEGGRASRSR
jgi:hypothetical protein